MKKVFCIFILVFFILSCKQETADKKNNLNMPQRNTTNTIEQKNPNNIFTKKGIVYVNEETGEYYFIASEEIL
ncbi:hypothetical protein [Spirobacillus cienkowskii]|jgi:thioredoxin-related protein|uniref:Uncharacterized protein n=1 Tax=Spirobacillus cienkowskii TaxID=495820 RepID=A0A369KR36_9BACT|nr:MAG: hypothetical protein DCC88_08080 [Spirobacillus cienkowskii]